MEEAKIGLGFIMPAEGAIGSPPESLKWFERKKDEVVKALTSAYPHLTFRVHEIRSPEDVSSFLKEEADSVGYLLFVLNCIAGLVRPILFSGKPVIMIAETYGGSGEFLLDYPTAIKEGMPVIGMIVRDVADKAVIERVKLLEVIHKLRNSKILFVVSSSEKALLEMEYPLSVDLYSYLKSVQAAFGITPILLDAREFVEKYYKKVSDAEARVIAERWIKRAKDNLEETSEIIKSAKLYLAMKRAVKDHQVNAIALDCIVLYRSGLLDAWPCLGYMELWNDGVVPVCEADIASAVLLLTMKYLADRHGFISDPSPDNLRGEVIYYHCYAPLCPYGSSGRPLPYVITRAHLGVKRASIYVEMPVNETVTAVGLAIEERKLTVHTAEALSNEFSEHACATKLIGKTNTKALIKNWERRSGWHRVVVYGDWREPLRELASLLRLKFIEEDKEA